MNFSAFDWFVLDASTRIWGQGFVLSAFPLLLIHLRCITLQKTQRVPCPPGPEPEGLPGDVGATRVNAKPALAQSEHHVVILLECFTEQMGFYEFYEVCCYKAKLLS